MHLPAKHVLITGASGTLGYAMVQRFLTEGAFVTAQCLRNAATLMALRKERDIPEEQLVIETVDLTEERAVCQMFDRLMQRTNTLSVLVNNAGGAKPQSWHELTFADWSTCLQLNLSAAFLCTQCAIPLLREQKGSVVNISSVAGLTGGAFGPHYAAVKAGLIGMTRSAARELGRDGIRVNAVAPGPVESEMTNSLPPVVLQNILTSTALERVVRSEEVAKAVYWLAVVSTAITGQTLVIDGGRHFL